MGIWCIIWGLIFAEGFGFVWDDTGQMGNSSPFDFIYDWTYYNIHVPGALADLLAMGGFACSFPQSDPGRWPTGVCCAFSICWSSAHICWSIHRPLPFGSPIALLRILRKGFVAPNYDRRHNASPQHGDGL